MFGVGAVLSGGPLDRVNAQQLQYLLEKPGRQKFCQAQYAKPQQFSERRRRWK
jgi:hypothetical protein